MSSSIGMIINPTEWKNRKWQPKHQPDIFSMAPGTMGCQPAPVDQAAAHKHFARQGHRHSAIIVGRGAGDAMLQTHALRGQGMALEAENRRGNSEKTLVNHRNDGFTGIIFNTYILTSKFIIGRFKRCIQPGARDH